MNNRLPEYFQLGKYNITSDDIVRTILHCDPDAIQEKVVVTPIWQPDIFANHTDGITSVSKGVVYQLEYNRQAISLIRSGIGAPLTGDVVLSLGCTPCTKIVFTGSVGGLDTSMKIGDLVIPQKSLCGDGFSRYLDANIQTEDCFLNPIKPDAKLTEIVKNHASRLCQEKTILLHSGTVFSSDSIVAQFFHLDYLVESFNCIGIEMETSSVFRAAKLVGIRASALLQVSDVIPTNKSLFSGRSGEDMERRSFIKKTILTKVILDSITNDVS